ncbi:putative Integral membrane permease [Modestobacter italicus]|uniref:Integral membrane permease n=1 Tax=Modestobacter italicus (strain DSM 44449 / CECT 9708 / BC 501) TaxID=2732864 RepID=I4EXY1_MODI5|nr:hypothetical protein [Modestobacter marinus]CCH88244.1 putative Integral membrane permease [Modestobacter marinus]
MTQLGSPTVQPAPAAALTADERSELLRLRREMAELQTQPRPRTKRRWRSLVAVVLIVLGCVLAPVAGVAVWVNNQVSDTDRFVRTMSPLVDDPDVQAALTNRLTTTVFQYVDVQGIADDAVDALGAQGLPPQVVTRLETLTPTLASAVTGFVRDRIAQLVASDRFERVWDQAITTAHRQLDAVLSGDSQGVVVRGDAVFLDLAPFIDLAKERLSQAGLTAVDLVPEVHPSVEIAKADTLVRAQSAYTALDNVARVLPWVVLLLFAVGVYLARNRFRALVGTGLGLALSMVVLAAAILVARGLLVGEVPAAAAPATASGFDIVVTYLRLGLRTLLVLGLVLALAGFLAGRSDTAVHFRRSVARRLHETRGGPAADGPVATWVRAHVRGLRIGAVAVAVLVFVFLTQPSGIAVLVIATGLLVVLAVIEFLGRPATAPPVPADAVP